MVSEVSFPRFWGVLWGGLFSGIFRFGDRKCRFRDGAICTYITNIYQKYKSVELGNQLPIVEQVEDCLEVTRLTEELPPT